jgi:hypothetical protein
MKRRPSPAFEAAHLQVMDRLRLTDADPAIQKAFGLCYRSGSGRVVLEFLIKEL